MKTKNISRIISLLLTLIMIFGTLPTVAFAEAEAPDAQSTQPAAEQIKFYNKSGSNVTKTLKSEGTYKKDNKLVAEYKNNVLDLYDYNGGRIEARGGSLTVRVHGTNTIQVDLLNNGISILEQKPDKANEKVYALKITGADDNAALHFVVNPVKTFVDIGNPYDGCFDIDGTKHTYISLENLTIQTEHNETEQNEYDLYQNGIIDLIRNCKVNLYYGTIRADLVENSELTTTSTKYYPFSFLTCSSLLDSTVNVTNQAGVYITNHMENCNITSDGRSFRCTIMENSVVRAKDVKTNWIYDCTIDAEFIYNLADSAITIDNSIVNINSPYSGSMGIENNHNAQKHTCNDVLFSMDEPSIIIRNKSKITINDARDGITTFGCGILIDNSEVTMRTKERGFRISEVKGCTQCATMYGLHITGKSKVKVYNGIDSNFKDIYQDTNQTLYLSTSAFAYPDEEKPKLNNTIDLSAGGFVELHTHAYDSTFVRDPANKEKQCDQLSAVFTADRFSATLGSDTRVVTGVYDEDSGYIYAAATAAGYLKDGPYRDSNGNMIKVDVSDYKTRIVGPMEALTGSISYSGSGRYNDTLTADVIFFPTGAKVQYQWQLKDGDDWKNIDKACEATFAPTVEMVGKEIRVLVTAEECTGTLYGAAKTVGKSITTGTPDKPVFATALVDGAVNVSISNYDSKVEYVYTTNASYIWPTGGTPINGSSFTVEQTENPQTIYVYARYKATDNYEPGTGYSGGSVLIAEKGYSVNVARDMIYPAYDSKSPTVYMKKGDTLKIKYSFNSINPNENLPRWKDSYAFNGGKSGSIAVKNDAINKTLTLTVQGNATGTAGVVAYKSNEDTPWYYGTDYSAMGRTIQVVVYDPTKLDTVPISTTVLPDVDLYVGDSYSIDWQEMKKLPFVPDDVDKSKYTYSAYVKSADNMVGANYVGETAQDGSVTIQNAVLSAKSAGTATVYVFAQQSSTVPKTATGYFASFTVHVTEKPVLKLEKLTLNPSSITLRVGETFKLKAVKEPAEVSGRTNFTCRNTDVASVSSGGTVKAVGVGTATVLAICSDKGAAAKVTVLPALCETHTKVYTCADGSTHAWTCSVCQETGIEAHTGKWTADKDADTHSITCTLCSIPQESKSEAHTWVQNGDEIPAQVGKAGKINYTCEVCAAEKSEEIPAVNAIPQAAVTVPAPSNGGKAAVATIAAEDCDVTLTEWFEGGNDVYIDDDFSQNKTYTIEVTLVALGNNAFTDSTAFTVNGMAAKVIYKTANSVTLSYTFTPVEQHKHTAAAEWSRDASHHWKACSFAGCGAVIEETRAAHDFAWIVDQAATETAAGKKHEECKTCGYKKSAVEIPATGKDDPTEVLRGDVEADGMINVADIVKLKSLIMNQTWTETQLKAGDLNNSGKLDVADIMAVKNIIMGS